MRFFVLAIVFILPMNPSLRGDESSEFRPELFAFQTGFANAKKQNAAYLAGLVRSSGFDGIELMGAARVAEFLPRLAEQNLKLHSIYLPINLDDENPTPAELISLLEAHGEELHYLWFHIRSQRFRSSDSAGDDRCVEVLRRISEMVSPYRVKIGIYHHVHLWAETFEDSVRVARKTDRENVGAVFNLCHYLKTSGSEDLETELSDAVPHLMLVSINGADDGDTKTMGWNQLIQPLGAGSFDLLRVLRVLKERKYAGPIGLQGFAIREKPEQFFPQSVKAYRQMIGELNGE